MNEADRVARQKVAERKAHERAEGQRQARQEADDRVALYREVHRLIDEVLALASAQGFESAEPMTVRTLRFPPLNDLFGWRVRTRGGWDIGSYGAQGLALLADGRICNCGIPARSLSDIDWCVSTVRDGLEQLRDQLSSQ